mmetsp:Transcript_62701/g.149663  ORF Transcript_62701/g.149663 Transcript_62701/m.149663 type:complete len:249 (+) Transcript_62701:1056-1802(+)
MLIRKADLHMDLQAPGSQESLINQVLAVCHADEQNVVQGVYAVNLRQQLVHDAVMDPCPVTCGPSRLADRINLIENHHVQRGILPQCLFILLSICEQVSNVLLCLAHVLVEDLWAIYNFWLGSLQEFRQLPGDQRLPRAGGAVQQHASDMADPQVPDHVRREDAGGKSPAEDVAELLAEATDAEVLEVEIRPKNVPLLQLVAQHMELPGGPLLKVQLCEGGQEPRVHLLNGCSVPEVRGHEATDFELQ